MRSWGGLFSPLFLCVLAIAIFAGAFVPDDLARDHRWAREFAAAVRSALLEVSRHADINAHASTTAFPHAALLSHAWMWTGIAVLVVYNSVASLINWAYWMEWLLVHRPRTTGPSRSSIAIGAALLLSGPAVFSMLPGSTSSVGHADLTSRLFFTLLSCSILFMWHLMSLSWLPAIHALILRRKNH